MVELPSSTVNFLKTVSPDETVKPPLDTVAPPEVTSRPPFIDALPVTPNVPPNKDA